MKDTALLILRIVFGGLMLINHGWGKMMKLFTGDPSKFADPIGLGAPVSLGLASFAEALCAALIVVGLFTRWATAPLIITMLVAAFIVHWGDPLSDMEGSLTYLAAYIAIAMLGPGRFSIDALMGRE